MKNQIDYSGFIEKYLNQTMDRDELKWFKQEMEINPSLDEEVQMNKAIGDAILNEETLAYRDQINSLFENKGHVKPAGKKKSFRIHPSVHIAVASLAALIILGTGILTYTHRTIPAEKLFENYYEPYGSLMNVRSSNSQTADLLVSAMQKYQEENFESALLLFETVLASDSQNITSKFYSGISYLETQRYNNALNTFTGIIDHNDNLFIEHAEWYLGLCYLKTGNKEKAKTLFSSIEKSDGYYSKKSRQIMRNM